MAFYLETNEAWDPPHRGFSVIEITGFPERMPDDGPYGAPSKVPIDILDICVKGGLSPELIFTTSGTGGVIVALLLLRIKSSNKKQALIILKQYPEIIRDVLIRAGFKASLPDWDTLNDPNRRLFPELCFGGSLSDKVNGFICCAKDHPADSAAKRPYLPGTLDRVQPFTVDLLMGVLSAYPQSMISIQLDLLNPGKTTVGELERQRRILSDCHFPEVFPCTTALDNYLESINRGKGLFDLRIMIVGNHAFCTELSARQAAAGYQCIELPKSFFHSLSPKLGTFKRKHYDLIGSMNTRLFLDGIAHKRNIHPVSLAFNRWIGRDYLYSVLKFPGSQEEINITTNLSKLSDPAGIYIGDSSGGDNPVYIPLKEFNYHGFITGKTGSGKTNFAMGLLIRMAEKGLNFLVFEPTKSEYRNLLSTDLTLKGLKVYTPGNEDACPMPLNIFIPPKGIFCGQYIRILRDIFSIAFSTTEFVSSLLPEVLQQSYAHYGWQEDSTIDSKGIRRFGLHEFLLEYRKYVNENILNPDDRNTVLNAGMMRYQKLLSDNPAMFDTLEAPDYEAMLKQPTVIELDSVTDEGKALITSLLLMNLRLVLKSRRKPDNHFKNVIFIDEAHVLLAPEKKALLEGAADPSGKAVNLLTNMVREVRAYGVGMLFGDQHASSLTKEISGDVNVKMMFLTDDREDLTLLEEVGHLDKNMCSRISTFSPGEGYIRINEMQKPTYVRVRNSEKEYNIPKDTENEDIRRYMKPEFHPPFRACRKCAECDGQCDPEIRRNASLLARQLAIDSVKLGDEAEQRKLPDYIWNDAAFEKDVDMLIAKHEGSIKSCQRLYTCTRICLSRNILLRNNCKLTSEELLGPDLPDPEPQPPASTPAPSDPKPDMSGLSSEPAGLTSESQLDQSALEQLLEESDMSITDLADFDLNELKELLTTLPENEKELLTKLLESGEDDPAEILNTLSSLSDDERFTLLRIIAKFLKIDPPF